MSNLMPRLAEHREAAILRAILNAARGAFAQRGFSGASMRFIAQEAGVSPQTIYAHFGSKSGLVMGLVDLLDDEADLAEMFDSPAESNDAEGLLRVLATASRRVHQRCGDIVHILTSGAAIDSSVAATRAEGIKRNRAGVNVTLERVRSAGGQVVDRGGDIAAALMATEVVDSLVKDSGWSFDEYEEWLGNALVQNLLAANDRLE